jgi:hypothetical protein
VSVDFWLFGVRIFYVFRFDVFAQRMTGRFCCGWYPTSKRCSSLKGTRAISALTRLAQNVRALGSADFGVRFTIAFSRGRTDLITCQTGVCSRRPLRFDFSAMETGKRKKPVLVGSGPFVTLPVGARDLGAAGKTPHLSRRRDTGGVFSRKPVSDPMAECSWCQSGLPGRSLCRGLEAEGKTKMKSTAVTARTPSLHQIVFAPKGLRWFHAGTSLVNWFVEPGQVFRAGDPLYRFCVHQRFESFAAKERIEYAVADGILVSADPPGKRILGGMVLGFFLLLEEWLPYTEMLERQEKVIRMFVESRRFTADDPAPLLEECRELRERRRRWLDEIPLLRQEEMALRREFERESERARFLSRQEQSFQSAETDLRQKYPLSTLLDTLSTAELPDTFPRDSIAADLAALPGLLLAFLEQKYALVSDEAALLAEESRWLFELSETYSEFGQERNDIVSRHTPESPALKADLKTLRRKCQKYQSAAKSALSRPYPSAAAASGGGSPHRHQDTAPSESQDQSPFSESA